MLHTAAATESLLAAIRISDLITRDGRGVQVLLKRLRLTGIVSENLGCLRRLACGKLSHRELVFERLDALIFGINLVLTQLVDDALGACGLARDDVADAVGQRGTVGAVLRKDGSGLLRELALNAVEALAEVGLDPVEALLRGELGVERLLHVRHLTGVGSGLGIGEAACDGHLHVRTAVAELGGEVLDPAGDAVQRHGCVLVGEALSRELGLIQPRVQLVAASIAAAAPAAEAAVEATEQGDENEDPPSVPVAPAAAVTAITASAVSDCGDVGKRILVHSHRVPFDIRF